MNKIPSENQNVIIILPDLIGLNVAVEPALEKLFSYFKSHNNCMKIIGFFNCSEIFVNKIYYKNITLINRSSLLLTLNDITPNKTTNTLIDFLSAKELNENFEKEKFTYRVGINYYNNDFYNYPVVFSEDNISIVHDYFEFLNIIIIPYIFRLPKFFISEFQSLDAIKYLEKYKIDLSKPFFIFGVGGGNIKKRWPLDKYLLLKSYLEKSYNGSVLFVTGPKEMNLKNELEKNNQLILDSLPLPLLMSIVWKSKLTISNDYALMHISASLCVPTIGVFLSSNPSEWFFYDKPSTYVIGKKLNCRPCYSEVCKEWLCNDESLLKLVLNKIKQILN